MASGKLLKNQIFLIKYFEILEKMNIDKSISIPTSNDIEFLVNSVRGKTINLLEILSTLTLRFLPRVVEEAAIKTIKEVLGEEINGKIAVELIAKDLAAWTIEIAEGMNLIKIDLSIIK